MKWTKHAIARLAVALAGGLTRRSRMAVARVYDRVYPHSCWANSVAWAIGVKDVRLERTSTCPDARSSSVGCWCGKFCGEVKDHRQPPF